MTEIDKYLLRAPKPDMARWKATADRRGLKFSEHIRNCLERFERNNPRWPDGSIPATKELAKLGEEPFMPRLSELVGVTIADARVDGEYLDMDFEGGGAASFKIFADDSPVEAAAAAVEGPAGAAASTGDLAVEPAVPPGAGSPSPVDSSEEPADLVQTPARPPASPELTINRPDLIDEARRLAGRMRR